MTSLVILSSVASNIFKHVVGVTYQRICLIASTTSGGMHTIKTKETCLKWETGLNSKPLIPM